MPQILFIFSEIFQIVNITIRILICRVYINMGRTSRTDGKHKNFQQKISYQHVKFHIVFEFYSLWIMFIYTPYLRLANFSMNSNKNILKFEMAPMIYTITKYYIDEFLHYLALLILVTYERIFWSGFNRFSSKSSLNYLNLNKIIKRRSYEWDNVIIINHNKIRYFNRDSINVP